MASESNDTAAPSAVARDLEGKVALVTGSSQGLGAAIARRFVAAGARVLLTGLERDKGEALAAELGAGTASYYRGDLGRVEDCRALVAAAERVFGGVDILVNSAGDTNRSTLESFTPEQFDLQFHVNVRAPLLLCQAALPSLRARKGTVINIGSINAPMGAPELLVYSATKGALETASRNLAYALKYDRVRVFCLNVGWMDSDGERIIQRKLGQPADFMDKLGADAPMGRLVAPREVAEVCAFLASGKVEVFSGAVIELEQFPTGSLSWPSREGGSQSFIAAPKGGGPGKTA